MKDNLRPLGTDAIFQGPKKSASIRSVYIKRVILENIKGFTRLDFDFERVPRKENYEGWTVITGDNASGKTALLKAIALAVVGPDVARVLQPSLRGWLKQGSASGSIAVEIVPQDEDRWTKGGPRYQNPFWAQLELASVDGGPDVHLSSGNPRKKGAQNGPWNENTQGWFIVGYGPFRRLYGESPGAQRLMLGPGRIAGFATMFKEDATLRECELWLKDLAHKRLENRPRESAVLTQVISLLNRDFLRNGLRIVDVNSDGLWLRDAKNTLLALEDMSEGYRAALAMLVDIVRQLVNVYGHQDLVVPDENAEPVIGHPGVVLIDEIDSHLHPEWQRRIGFWLKRHFPLMQFIVTTHSPLICQAADEGGIFHLPSSDSDAEPFQLSRTDYENIIRSPPDAIYLSPAFDLKQTRSPRAIAARKRFSELKSKNLAGGLSPEERRLMKQLSFWTDEPEHNGG